MIISDIKYVPLQAEAVCSTSACLSMFLSFYGFKINPAEISDMFGQVFMSHEFNRWYTLSLDVSKYEGSAMLCCAQYLIDKYFPKISCAVHPTEVSRIRLSYVKRRMPVLLTGRFPLLSGRVPNTVLVKGYVGDYLIVNDPRGNANARYVDRHGENMIYSCENLHDWACVNGPAYLLRAIPTESGQPRNQEADM